MKKTKSRIPLKVFLSYLALASLVVIVGGMVYKEISSFAQAQRDETVEKNKILRIGKLLTLMYESESFARSAIQSNTQEPYISFLRKNDSISIQIDSLKQLIDEAYQSKLLDSVNHLLAQKVKNINELRELRINDTSEKSIETTIEKLTNIEEKLGRLSLKDFVENPDSLDPATREMLMERVAIYNRYIPRDSSNSVDEKTLDSIVTASREMLQDIKEKASTQKLSLAVKERQLLRNDLTTSQQLRQILTAFEDDFINDARLLNMEREKVLQRSIRVITVAAIIGAVLVIVFSIIILRDSWRSQQYKKQIEDSNEHNKLLLKSREQLISMVSHDLRTPLSTILGYTQLLKDAKLNEKESHYTDRIKNASSYVTQLVDDLLDFTKLEAGKIHLERVSFNLNNLINETAESVQSLYRSKEIKLIIDADPEINKLLLGDPFRVKQILSNLIGNAYKFTSEGSITVKTRLKTNSENKQFITLSVIDTGIGIKKEKQKIIFEEFTQAESDTEKKYGGSGLGLTISRKLADLLDGHLYLESKEGKGSTFSFVFPAEFSHQEATETTHPKHEKAILKDKHYTAIVIDDDETLLQLNKEVLEEHNIQVYPFNNGKDALENIQNITYDFIITDIQLPTFNGFYFAETLRSDVKYHYKDQPIIAVTGRKDLDKESYIDAGFAEFLYKPYEPHKLMQKINKVLNNTDEPSGENEPEAEKKTINEAALYNLESLQSFLNDKESLTHVLDVFKENSKKDIKSLKVAIQQKEYDEVRKLGHKMQTMFKQISAHTVVPILNFLEHFPEDQQDQVEKNFKALKKNIKITFKAIDNDINR
ncbi:hybrid sensor histidine kinase/response regulator [Galbibacter pacificus]|uniref:histidine kinase n=1 Tax=Galbibacter pacificus TaxID=2996052 RepID=A0ABT6FTF5_9FLAO|nr:ATP-binding protein [Galbibacter pacificus]MDG3583054.1 ATP-binding protein [Galbibacter pacificus]MDG3586535.1 ATP-binding protein [Galbibacter pacificus]